MEAPPAALAALRLLRITPPQELNKALYSLTQLLSEPGSEYVLSRIDRVNFTLLDTTCNKYFVCSDYNRIGDAHRSPWTNSTFPTQQKLNDNDPRSPPSAENAATGLLRVMEVYFNRVFDTYRQQYMNGGVSSVYLWESPTSDDGYSAAFLLQKELSDEATTALWDVTHVVEVSPMPSAVRYRLHSTLHFKIDAETAAAGTIDLGITLTAQKEHIIRLTAQNNAEMSPQELAGFQMENIGPILTRADTELRRKLEDIHLVRLRAVLAGVRRQTVRAKQQEGPRPTESSLLTDVTRSLKQHTHHQKSTELSA